MLLQELIIYILYINSKEFHNILTYFHFLEITQQIQLYIEANQKTKTEKWQYI